MKKLLLAIALITCIGLIGGLIGGLIVRTLEVKLTPKMQEAIDNYAETTYIP